MLKRISSLILLSLLLVDGQAVAETVYVIDMLRVGIRAQPTGSGPSEAVVKSGDRLEVLEKQGQYYRVRSTDGAEGWVNRGYISEEPTAAQQLAALQVQNDKLAGEISSLKEARGSEGEQIEALQQKLAVETEAQAQLRRQRDALQQRLDAISASKEGVVARYRWALELLGALLLFGGGLYFGRCSYRCGIRRRFNGMEI